jgi:arylsulfatase A-like enzyme
LACASCGASTSAPELRSLLLITLDTTRNDVLTDDAAGRALTPRFAALAENGVRFSRAYTVTPLTLPAHASLLTGLVPPRHGVRDNGYAALPASATTLAELLAARGFETAAFVSSLVLDRGFGLDQGFASYDQPARRARAYPNESIERAASTTAREAANWLTRLDPRHPFFLWAHFYDAHLPYVPSSEHLARANGHPYRGEVAALDDAVGTLLDALEACGRARETLIVLTSDHGEGLEEHGEPAHGALLYETTTRVPLLFHFPGTAPRPGPTRLASLVDVVPTTLALLGLPAPANLDGLDLFSPGAPRERGVYLESFSGYLNYGWSPLAGWADGRGKYLHSPEPEFYATLTDPAETRDRAQDEPAACAQARERLAEVLTRPALPFELLARDAELDSALSALGYARGSDPGAALPSPLDPSDRPSPKSRSHELAPLQRAHVLFESGDTAACLPLVEGILRTNPNHPLALDYYALSLMYASRFEEAATALRQRLTLGEKADTRLNLGLCLLELGHPEDALPELEAAAHLAPDQPSIQQALQRAHTALRR